MTDAAPRELCKTRLGLKWISLSKDFEIEITKWKFVGRQQMKRASVTYGVICNVESVGRKNDKYLFTAARWIIDKFDKPVLANSIALIALKWSIFKYERPIGERRIRY